MNEYMPVNIEYYYYTQMKMNYLFSYFSISLFILMDNITYSFKGQTLITGHLREISILQYRCKTIDQYIDQ